MRDGEEQRRASRHIVDVEALLHLSGLRRCKGVIHDLSYLGCLFVPEQPARVSVGSQGTLRFALPTALDWLEPSITVRRLTTFTRMSGEQGQGIGMEFSGLTPAQEQAVSTGCEAWDGHRMRQYAFSARCYVQSAGGLTHYARFGQLMGGTRSYIRLSLPRGNISHGIALRLNMARTWVNGEVERVSDTDDGIEAVVRIEGWGGDFFLHEARRRSAV